jgi:hypothetical protein
LSPICASVPGRALFSPRRLSISLICSSAFATRFRRTCERADPTRAAAGRPSLQVRYVRRLCRMRCSWLSAGGRYAALQCVLAPSDVAGRATPPAGRNTGAGMPLTRPGMAGACMPRPRPDGTKPGATWGITTAVGRGIGCGICAGGARST